MKNPENRTSGFRTLTVNLSELVAFVLNYQKVVWNPNSLLFRFLCGLDFGCSMYLKIVWISDRYCSENKFNFSYHFIFQNLAPLAISHWVKISFVVTRTHFSLTGFSTFANIGSVFCPIRSRTRQEYRATNFRVRYSRKYAKSWSLKILKYWVIPFHQEKKYHRDLNTENVDSPNSTTVERWNPDWSGFIQLGCVRFPDDY